MKDLLHIALIGMGRMGRIYAKTLHEMQGVRLYAVASDDLDETAISPFDVPHRFHVAERALELEAVDAVVVATPTSTHHDLVIQAARRGKAVFCEKPLALGLEDTRRMIDAVEEAGVLLQVGFMRRFDPAYVDAKAALDSGDIGQPVSFKAIGRDPFCPDPAYANPAHSGGLIVDMGIHDMDLARWLMHSEVVRVTAEGSTLVCADLRAVGDLDNAVINLRFESGAVGNVEVSRSAFYGYDVRTEVLCSAGAVRVGHDQIPGGSVLRPAREVGSYLSDRFGPAYRAQIRTFVDCVRRGTPSQCTGQDALAAMEISLAATYAAQTGDPVSLEAVRGGWHPSFESA